MSKIQEVKIDWMEGGANAPRIQVLFDKLAPHDELRYKLADRCYLAIDEEYAAFWAWSGTGNDRGMGGHEVNVRMADGSELKLQGPWSSNSQAINERFPTPVTEAEVTDNPHAFRRGYTFTAAAVTIDGLLRYLAEHPEADFRMAIVGNYTGLWYQAVRPSGKPKDPKHTKVLQLL